ncbi:integral membrane protein [Aspergillus costaricaensis CBS 115574]|uniref:Integral membrane protein n=1 Tax=Aspergillus costaricaensis CBS 115574 TaxID=1448317 RepID=A0ACD1I018_9EURO|nr:integral membrane protein [Aspergillus costaricaensis CBS 115574]RAK83109.1 integral membrane protein [Aspergillus costaricaensis CBS 115574]
MSQSLPSADLSESRQPNLYASSTIPFFIAVVCVSLRFWCRWKNTAGLWLDDWLILASLACGTGLTASLLWWIPRALGRHIQTFGPNATEDAYIGLFSCELTYTGVIVLVKFSILALYWRLFNRANIKLPISLLATLVCMWGIAVFLLTLLQCIPTRGLWDQSIDASCNVDSQKFLFAISIPNIIIDVTLLVLPVPYIMKLNTSRSHKKAIMSMFLLGSFVCIASIMRLVSVMTQGTDADVSWNWVNQAIWANIEADLAIVSACLPTLRPVWVAVRRSLFGTQATNQSTDPSSWATPQKRAQASSWATKILKSSSYDNEDTQPFSALDSHTEEGVHRYSALDQSQAKTAVAIPLPTLNKGQPHEEGITVKRAWDVEYNQ